MEDLIIGTSWSGDGDVYTIEYVNRLVRGVRRNTTVPHRFVLYAGPTARASGDLRKLEPDVEVVPSNYQYWWTGMDALLRKEDYFAIGLDCVIIGSLDDLLTYPSKLVAFKDFPPFACPPGHEQDVSLDVWLARGGAFAPAYDEWLRVGKPLWNPEDKGIEKVWHYQAQGWINSKPRPLAIDVWPDEWVVSYKQWVRRRGLPQDCRIVSFHGRPKPHEVIEPWIEEHWR
jgi:hypothetical protein